MELEVAKSAKKWGGGFDLELVYTPYLQLVFGF